MKTIAIKLIARDRHHAERMLDALEDAVDYLDLVRDPDSRHISQGAIRNEIKHLEAYLAGEASKYKGLSTLEKLEALSKEKRNRGTEIKIILLNLTVMSPGDIETFLNTLEELFRNLEPAENMNPPSENMQEIVGAIRQLLAYQEHIRTKNTYTRPRRSKGFTSNTLRKILQKVPNEFNS